MAGPPTQLPQAGPPLDEIQWRAPPDFEMGVHSNSVLFYFAQSPFYDRTSNNEVLFQQGLNNPNVTPFLATRELFEGRLKTMSGLEFVVAQEPAETGPGAGTGVWVINKQTRRKRQGEDEIIVHSSYFVVGENIYMAPTLADLISSRIATASSSVSKLLPAATRVQTWSPSLGRLYKTPQTPKHHQPQQTREATPLSTTAAPTTKLPTSRLLDDALLLDLQFGGQNLNENPITGRPGEFQLSSTGRVGPATAANAKKAAVIPTLPSLNTKLGGTVGGGEAAKMPTGKETKSPKTPSGGVGMGGAGMSRGKKRKGSKAAVTPQ
ncbi:MED6 mediator sub complex component-domain-containing protein [Staphylotrichum tortipilum]|uniref:Mediator of RNA polymerase II transcription subunit 6 n=1 Tax=Staphylotrichum tortipilum TaxID=2831512 RepID=A0AAN6MLI5_9PEZI|nr:MED6 mediator sub complex component-domain-containing protein [Staphylotrichum longicolle]